jgi:HTH-type transcriptional regulator, cell division transcriptional repressor
MANRKKNIVTDAKSSPIARGKRLKSLRMMADLSRKCVEEKYRISAGTLQSWEDGRYGGLTEKGAKRFLHVLQQEGIQCTSDWLLHGIGIGPQATDSLYLDRQQPVLEVEQMRANSADLAGEDQAIVTELLAFRRSNSNAIDIIVRDDGMGPSYQVGDYVGGKRRYNHDISNLVGRNCIIETTLGEIYLRHLRRGTGEHRYTLMCINPYTTVHEPTLYDVQLLSAAPVIWHRCKD